MLRRLISPTNTRARIYDRDGVLVLDSRNLYGRGDVLRFDLPPPHRQAGGFFERAGIRCANGSRAATCRSTRSSDRSNGKGYPEVVAALTGNAPSRSCASTPAAR